jgi:alkylhydroperoxidase family enzyme
LSKKGWLPQENLEALEDRGIDQQQLYEIIAIIGLQTISNYINHIAGTEVDEEFK